MLSTGALESTTPRGLVELFRQRAAGPLGLPSLFRVHAASRPDALAIVDDDGAVSWRELDARIDRLAAGLREIVGLQAGDAAVLVSHNRREIIEAQAALARLGAAAVAVSWRSTPDELEYLVEHSGAKAIFVDVDAMDAVAEARPRLSRVDDRYVVIGGDGPFGHAYDDLLTTEPGPRLDGREGRVVIYTSGTTGKPKGAVREFPPEMMWAVLHVLDELPLRHDDRHLAVCPMYHSTAFGFIGFTLVLGGTVVIERRFDPERFLAAVERHRITTTAIVPTMLHRVLDLPDATLRRYDTSSLHAVLSGGAPLSGALAARAMQRLGHVLYNFYGSTETGLNTFATPQELLRSPGTIGHAVGENEILLLDDRGASVPDGETGELWVRNRMLVSGYHADADATRASMRDGYFGVGDLAHRDADGLYHLDGRKRDMIISGGVNVYPAEVEEVLHQHPDVSEAAVVGVPDPEWGERVRACVVARAGGIDEGELVAWARERLAGPKCPREVLVLDALPKNPTGKVLKRQLRER